MAKQVRVAFVGSGGIATEAHLPSLKEIDGVEIAALCDAQKERAEDACRRFGGRPYADHREMLDREEIDKIISRRVWAVTGALAAFGFAVGFAVGRRRLLPPGRRPPARPRQDEE